MDIGDFDEYFEGLDDSLEELEESEFIDLPISSQTAKMNYAMAGQVVPEAEDQISIAAHCHLLNDRVHIYIQDVLQEVKLPYKLSDFQVEKTCFSYPLLAVERPL